MATSENRGDFQQWWDATVSCGSQFMTGSDEEAKDAVDLLKTITPYTKDWRVRYDAWHRKQNVPAA